MRLWFVIALAPLSCMALPPGPMERLNHAAMDLNTAARFGRMDIASAGVAAEAKADFGRRHRGWGKEIRIVDFELEGVQILGNEAAQVDLTVNWHRNDETVIRSTTIAQRWTQSGSDWRLAEETISGGASGLFPATKAKQEAAKKAERTALGQTVDVP
jgi:hypothetical protein